MSENKRHEIESNSLKNIGIPLFAMYSNIYANEILVTHNHQSCFEICYLKRGTQTYYVEGNEYVLVGGDVFIVSPYENHSTGNQPQARGCLYWFQIDSGCQTLLGLDENDSRIIMMLLNTLKSRIIRVSENTASKLIHAYSLIERGNPADIIAGRSLLIAFIFEMCDISDDKSGKSGVSEQILTSVKYISEHIREHLEISDLADKLNFSLSHYKFKFKKEIGMPPGEYIIQQKIFSSIPLLADNTLTYIAYEYGFSSSQHYSKTFKAVTGMTPSEYRLKIKSDKKLINYTI